MSAPPCPHCYVLLSPQEMDGGWCKACGNEIPSWIKRESPPSLQAEYPSLPEEIVASRPIPARPLASRLARLAAVVFDLVVWLSLCYLGAALANAWGVESGELREEMASCSVLLSSVSLGLMQVVLLSNCGQTLGKRVMGVRVVLAKSEGSPGFMGAVVFRILVPGVISLVPLIGPVFAVVNVLFIFAADRRCLHDRIAWTKVVRA